MATQVFLGNPSQSVIDWIKGHPPHPPQQLFAVIVNNTHLPTAAWPNIDSYYVQNIALSGSSISYKILPGLTKNIKPGTYRTIVTNKYMYDSLGSHYDDGTSEVCININNTNAGNLDANGIHYTDYDHDAMDVFTLNYDDGTSEYFESDGYTYEGEYTYNVNVNYEFTYGQKYL